MYSLRGIAQRITLLVFLAQPIFSEVVRFNDGGIAYEYDSSSKPLGRGSFATVFAGIRVDGNHSESVAFKEFKEHLSEGILKEIKMCEMMGHHHAFPTFYRFFPETNETKAVIVMERIGRTLKNLLLEFRPFPNITAMQVGLQMLDAVEWMHSNGLTHNDLHVNNIAVGYHNKSKIYVFDFTLANLKKDQLTGDVGFVSHTLKELIQPNSFDLTFEQNSVLKEFEAVANSYANINDASRHETFEKLRNILRTELDKHKHGADYRKFDIGYIQDAVDVMQTLKKLIKQNDTSAIKSLIQSHQELDINFGFGAGSQYKPIHLAVEFGNTSVVQLLLDHGAEIDNKFNSTHYELSPLHYAAENGYVEKAQILIEHGAEINAKCPRGNIPLHYAINNGSLQLVKNLIEHGAKIDALDFQGKTPLLCAVMKVRIEIVKLLIANGAKVTDNGPDGQTLLHHAASWGLEDLVRILIENGAEINARNLSGKTPLHLAAAQGKEGVAKFLIERGADIKAKDTNGKTPLDHAKMQFNFAHESEEIIKILEGAEQNFNDGQLVNG